jgi:hypothetical protein
MAEVDSFRDQPMDPSAVQQQYDRLIQLRDRVKSGLTANGTNGTSILVNNVAGTKVNGVSQAGGSEAEANQAQHSLKRKRDDTKSSAEREAIEEKIASNLSEFMQTKHQRTVEAAQDVFSLNVSEIWEKANDANPEVTNSFGIPNTMVPRSNTSVTADSMVEDVTMDGPASNGQTERVLPTEVEEYRSTPGAESVRSKRAASTTSRQEQTEYQHQRATSGSNNHGNDTNSRPQASYPQPAPYENDTGSRRNGSISEEDRARLKNGRDDRYSRLERHHSQSDIPEPYVRSRNNITTPVAPQPSNLSSDLAERLDDGLNSVHRPARGRQADEREYSPPPPVLPEPTQAYERRNYRERTPPRHRERGHADPVLDSRPGSRAIITYGHHMDLDTTYPVKRNSRYTDDPRFESYRQNSRRSTSPQSRRQRSVSPVYDDYSHPSRQLPQRRPTTDVLLKEFPRGPPQARYSVRESRSPPGSVYRGESSLRYQLERPERPASRVIYVDADGIPIKGVPRPVIIQEDQPFFDEPPIILDKERRRSVVYPPGPSRSSRLVVEPQEYERYLVRASSPPLSIRHHRGPPTVVSERIQWEDDKDQYERRTYREPDSDYRRPPEERFDRYQEQAQPRSPYDPSFREGSNLREATNPDVYASSSRKTQSTQPTPPTPRDGPPRLGLTHDEQRPKPIPPISRGQQNPDPKLGLTMDRSLSKKSRSRDHDRIPPPPSLSGNGSTGKERGPPSSEHSPSFPPPPPQHGRHPFFSVPPPPLQLGTMGAPDFNVPPPPIQPPHFPGSTIPTPAMLQQMQQQNYQQHPHGQQAFPPPIPPPPPPHSTAVGGNLRYPNQSVPPSPGFRREGPNDWPERDANSRTQQRPRDQRYGRYNN